jgi:hypothetical protein
MTGPAQRGAGTIGRDRVYQPWAEQSAGERHQRHLSLDPGETCRLPPRHGQEVRFAVDSPLEGDGFEPLVSQQIRSRFRDSSPIDGLTVSRPGTESSNPSPSTSESRANLSSSILVGAARWQSPRAKPFLRPCRYGPKYLGHRSERRCPQPRSTAEGLIVWRANQAFALQTNDQLMTAEGFNNYILAYRTDTLGNSGPNTNKRKTTISRRSITCSKT